MADAANNGGGQNTDGKRFVTFDFLEGGGCIPDSVMQELSRRLSGYVASGDEGYIRSVGPPNDQTATWVPIDADGNRVGNNRVYNSVTGQWTDDFGSGVPAATFISADLGNLIRLGGDKGWYVGPPRKNTSPVVVNSNGTRTVNFTPWGVLPERIEVRLFATSDPGANGNFRWYVESITDGEVKIKFLGFDNTVVPSISYMVVITEVQ